MTALLKHRTISSAIAAQLRDSVLSGALVSGAQLRQDALAQSFGVSRIPVREALFQLEADGLVQIVPHKGAIVTGLSRAEVDDVFALRLLLEVRLLAHSAPHLDAADFERLDAIQIAFSEAIQQQDKSRWGSLNASLHAALYCRADLPRTAALVASLLTASERYTRIQLATTRAWMRAQAEHAELIVLCRAGRTDDACGLLATHISTVHLDIQRMLDREPELAGGQ